MDEDYRRVVITNEGPILIHGSVDVEMPDGTRVRSDRAVTALCACGRSRRRPFCDTSHRRRVRNEEERRRERDS